jgi:hypothetical protein
VTIRLDSTKHSTVVLCSHCPWWRGFADTQSEGWRVGARHEERPGHPATKQAREALRMRETRRAGN